MYWTHDSGIDRECFVLTGNKINHVASGPGSSVSTGEVIQKGQVRWLFLDGFLEDCTVPRRKDEMLDCLWGRGCIENLP